MLLISLFILWWYRIHRKSLISIFPFRSQFHFQSQFWVIIPNLKFLNWIIFYNDEERLDFFVKLSKMMGFQMLILPLKDYFIDYDTLITQDVIWTSVERLENVMNVSFRRQNSGAYLMGNVWLIYKTKIIKRKSCNTL